MGIFERSLIGGGLILLIWAARAGLRRRVPGKLMLLLWAAALLRLLLPVGFEVRLPALPLQQTAMIRESLTGGGADSLPITADTQQMFSAPGASGEAGAVGMEEDHSRMIGGWLIYGAGAGLTGAAFAALYIVNRCRLGGAALLEGAPEPKAGFREVRLYESAKITSPVSLGVFRPRIILPAGMRIKEAGMDMILRHELEHIRGFHGLWKLISAAAICVHWFNPLVWIMRALIARDLELIADEAALDGEDRREEYAYLLIRMAEKGGASASFANSFGGKRIKERIVIVMKKRKNSVWAIVLAALLLMASVCAFAEPVQSAEQKKSETVRLRSVKANNGVARVMTRAEFREWYIQKAILLYTVGEFEEEQFTWVIDNLEEIMKYVEGDQEITITSNVFENDEAVGEIVLLRGSDGVERILFADSLPVEETLGMPVEQKGNELVALEPQTVEMLWADSADEILESRETMTRDEFRKWYSERSLLMMAAGDIAESEFVWLNIDGLQALLDCVDGDEVEVIAYTLMKDGAVKSEVFTITGRDGKQRVVFMDSYPAWEGALGAVAERNEETMIVWPGMAVELAEATGGIDLGEREAGEEIRLRLHDPELAAVIVGLRMTDGSLAAFNMTSEEDCTFTIPIPEAGEWEAFVFPIDRETDAVYIELE